MAESERGDRSVDPGSALRAVREKCVGFGREEYGTLRRPGKGRFGDNGAVAAPLSRRAAGTAGPGTPMAGGCAGGPQKNLSPPGRARAYSPPSRHHSRPGPVSPGVPGLRSVLVRRG
jgi:hypothetical protein